MTADNQSMVAELRFRTMPFPDGLDAPMRARARAIGLPMEDAGGVAP